MKGVNSVNSLGSNNTNIVNKNETKNVNNNNRTTKSFNKIEHNDENNRKAVVKSNLFKGSFFILP